MNRVTVIMITYSHEAYIQKAIEGVLTQNCDFDFELLISNDCSPDKTDEIVKEIISTSTKSHLINYYNHSLNLGMIKNFNWALGKANSKYIAICDGDDYWIDPMKLQKQVSFLESNPNYGLIHTQYGRSYFPYNSFEISRINRSDNSFNSLIANNPIITSTVCFRQDLYKDYVLEIEPADKDWVACDTPIWLWFAKKSNIYFLDNLTTVNHIIPGSASNTNSSKQYLNFIKSRLSIREYFIKNYGGNPNQVSFIYNDFYVDGEYHILKLREFKLIESYLEHLRRNRRVIKYIYISNFYRFYKFEFLYKFLFIFYRIFHRINNSSKY